MSDKMILSWDETFMQLANIIGFRSKDPSTQVGSIVVDENNVVVGLGYNGWPRGIEHDDLPWDREGDFVNTKYPYIVHSEANAIFNANKPTKGCKIYVNLFPCNECAKIIIQNGIREVIYSDDKYHDDPVWIASRTLFEKAGISCRQYIPMYDMKLTVKEKSNE